MKKVILLTEGTSTFARNLLLGIAEYSRLNGLWAFYRELLTPFYRSQDQPKNLKHLKSWNADGIIIRSTGEKMTTEALALGLPLIACDDDNQIPNVPNVVTDYAFVGQMAADHFLKRGFKHFAYCGFDNKLWSRERCVHFKEAINQAGHDVFIYQYPKQREKRLLEKELPLISKWIKSLPKPVAIMACNDDRANQVMICCNLEGLYVPEDVCVLGVDNDQLLCEMCNPPLSSIALNTRKAGYQAANLLDEMIQGKKVTHHNICARPTHIAIRQSTDTLAIDDRDVITAIQYIRKHAREPIQVKDVADHVALSNRSLFEKFKNHLGRTVHDEIKRVRIENIAQMLLQTDLPVKQIASLFHFSSVEHIARYFRDETKMTPLAYRKKYSNSSTSTLITQPE